MDDAVKLGAKAIGSLPYPLNEYSIAKEVLDAVGFTTMQDREATLIREREWQPIETAPKDGTTVIVTNGTHVVLAENIYDNGWTYSQTCSECRDDVHPAPTHWMPLPNVEALGTSGLVERS